MLFLVWPPVRAVCTNHGLVVFQPRTGTSLYLGYVDIIITTYSSHLPPHLFQPFLGLIFPDLTPIAPPFSTSWCRFALSLHPLLPPNSPRLGATVHLDGAPTRRSPPLVCAYLPLWAATRIYSREPVTAATHMVGPPSPSSTCAQVPVSPRGSFIRVSLLPSVFLRCPHVCSPPCRP